MAMAVQYRTFGDLVLFCSDFLGIGDAADSQKHKRTIRALINMANADVCNTGEYDWLEASAVMDLPAGTAGIAVPDGDTVTDSSGAIPLPCRNIVHAEMAYGNALKHRPHILESFISGAPGIRIQDNSARWGTFGRRFYATPPPSAATTVTLYYVAVAPGLSADDDESLIPLGHRQILAYKAILAIVSTDLVDGRKQAWAREQIKQAWYDMPKSNLAWPQYRAMEHVTGQL